MTAPDLKPCPFCGHRAETQEYGMRTEVWAVWCVECKAQMESISTKAEAIAAWNTRTTPLAEALEPVTAPRRYMGQIMAECDCQHYGCVERGYCMAQRLNDQQNLIDAYEDMMEFVIFAKDEHWDRLKTAKEKME